MSYLRRIARQIKARSPLLTKIHAQIVGKPTRQRMGEQSYSAKLAKETDIYKDVEDINVLPPIFHYWSHTYVRPLLEELGVANPDEFFAKYLRESADRCRTEHPVFISIGAGNCDTEVRIAQLIKKSGLSHFVIECLDMNPHMLARGRQMAQREGVAEHIVTTEGDFNGWNASKRYDGIMVNQALHHVLNLEGLFGEIRRALKSDAYFVTSDMIGRNGHQRWPEALVELQRYWHELPTEYRYNQQLNRQEDVYENWDCSNEGFEGIRAQDILPLLLKHFHMHVFIGFGNVVDIFVDRSFGHNFDAGAEWDRSFIDRLHAFDEEALRSGKLTPTHLMAAMTLAPLPNPHWSRGLNPAACVRKAD